MKGKSLAKEDWGGDRDGYGDDDDDDDDDRDQVSGADASDPFPTRGDEKRCDDRIGEPAENQKPLERNGGQKWGWLLGIVPTS